MYSGQNYLAIVLGPRKSNTDTHLRESPEFMLYKAPANFTRYGLSTWVAPMVKSSILQKDDSIS